MDPNETLRRLRQIAADLLRSADAATECATVAATNEEAANEAAELFQALDQWISRGGFLPTAWKAPESSAEVATSRDRSETWNPKAEVRTFLTVDLQDEATRTALYCGERVRPLTIIVKDGAKASHVHVSLWRYGVTRGVKVGLTAVNKRTDVMQSVNAVPWKLEA